MGAIIARQPNGLLCRFSSVVECPTHYNLTDEQYLSNITETVANRAEGQEILALHLQPFSEVLENFRPLNMTQQHFDRLVMEMTS